MNAKGEKIVEELEIFHCDSVEYVCELLSNPAFKYFLQYVPKQVFEDDTCAEHIFNKICTGVVAGSSGVFSVVDTFTHHILRPNIRKTPTRYCECPQHVSEDE